jgi:hypothetical protein
MRISIAAALFVAPLILSCNLAGGKTSKQVNSHSNYGTPTQDIGVTKETAVRTAGEDAKKQYGNTDQFIIIPCAQDEFWRVFFEPRNSAPNTSGAEYLIDNKTGAIISKHELPLGAGTNFERSPERSAISREEAVTIARKDADNAYGSSTTLSLTVCELSSVWRIIYSPRQGLNGGGPEYVIDKTTGKILDKKYYQ